MLLPQLLLTVVVAMAVPIENVGNPDQGSFRAMKGTDNPMGILVKEDGVLSRERRSMLPFSRYQRLLRKKAEPQDNLAAKVIEAEEECKPTHEQCRALLKPVDSLFSFIFGKAEDEDEEEKARIIAEMTCFPTYEQCAALLTPRFNSFK